MSNHEETTPVFDSSALADRLDQIVAILDTTRGEILDLAAELRRAALELPWDRDISAELATNSGPYSNEYLERDGGWWPRTLDQIDGLTFHHTLSDSPHATAEHYINKDGGRPSIPYTVWVAQTGEVLLCVDLEEGLWHDHTGHENTHLSVGLAGSLHQYHPADAQLDAAAKVAAWAIASPALPGIRSIEQVTGHRDWVATVCPGWESAQSGYWKPELYERIERALEEMGVG
ncbi:MAG: N-acetylmuramoyl-L-alanine amidase [Anaerolineae bacterium]|nr:MAG: N-acetylmuramoyl-L-alanine amidase [Anaerolineae bacterium]